MLRRVLRVLRVGLFVVGALVLVWLPISFYYWVFAWSPQWMREEVDTNLTIADGAAVVVYPDVWYDPPDSLWIEKRVRTVDPDGNFLSPSFTTVDLRIAANATVTTVSVATVSIPLWLLAAICLAWPVTSLLLARRRGKGRGFEVEVASDE